jgi:hypothetical protein
MCSVTVYASVDSSTRSSSGASTRVGPSSAAAAVVTPRSVATLTSDVDDASLCNSDDMGATSDAVVSLSSVESFASEGDFVISTDPIDPSSPFVFLLCLDPFVSVFAMTRDSLPFSIFSLVS